jgi:microcystin-dependent protein
MGLRSPKRVFGWVCFFCFVLVVVFRLADAGSSSLSKNGFIFGNGSGLVVADDPSNLDIPTLKVRTSLMAANGLIIDDGIPTASYTFLATSNVTLGLQRTLIGMIAAFGYVPAASTGWLVCNGANYNATTYQSLADALRNKYGGTGSLVGGRWTGNFNVPDLRGLFIIGTTASGVAVASTNAKSSFKSHIHSFVPGPDTITNVSDSTNTHTHQYIPYRAVRNDAMEDSDTDTDYTYMIGGTTVTSGQSGDISHTHGVPSYSFPLANASSTSGVEDTENRPLNAAVVYCIYAK